MSNGRKIAVTISLSKEDTALLEELRVRLKSTKTSVVSAAINLMHRLSTMSCNTKEKSVTYDEVVITPHKADAFKKEYNGGLDETQRSIINAANWPKGWLNKYGRWEHDKPKEAHKEVDPLMMKEVPKKKKRGWPKGKPRGPRKLKIEDMPKLRVVK